MASEVFFHIGLPKTGTTYLQDVLWSGRESLLAEGVLLPGVGHRQHLWAALDLQERRGLSQRHPRAVGSFAALTEQVRDWPGRAVISHEFFCGARREQVATAMEALAPADVHLVITARDTLGMLTAGWTEYVKNGGSRSLEQMPPKGHRAPEFSWRTWDLGDVLRRWGTSVPPERVHVLTMPTREEPADQHWRNFAGVLGLTGQYEPSGHAANPALGVAQIETLRRVNDQLTGFAKPVDRGRWIRGYLAEELLVRQHGDRPGASAEQVADCVTRAERAVATIRERGYDVVGDLERLLVDPRQPGRREPGEVTDDEVIASATALVADMLTDVRELRRRPTGP
ncbi:MAG TPA: hypothetical protein VH085_12880 [Nocardioides sp.]|nr:hypothetical protein [Nocardioides sp.]